MKQNKKLSFYTLLAVVLFVTTAIIMSLQTYQSYQDLHNRLNNEITNNAQKSLNHIEKRISPYIHSFSLDEYLQLLETIMAYRTIYGVIVEDYKLGNVLGQKVFVSGKIRDRDWNVTNFDEKNKEQQNSVKSQYLITTHSITDQNQKTIAKIYIYSSDRFLKEGRKEFIINEVFISIVIYGIYLFIIYFIIHHFFLKPILKIISSLRQTDIYDIPKMITMDSHIKEIASLESLLSSTIQTLKESRQVQSDQKKEFQMIFDYSKDGIFIMDLESNFLHFNEAYIKMTGFSSKELLKKSCLELTIIDQRDRAIKAIQEVIEKKQLENFEKICVVKDSKQLNINMSMALLPDGKSILATVKDMTHIKLIESQAKLAAMGEMIGNIAHQWRQPLTVISTGASGAKVKKRMGILDDEDFNKTMGIIVDQTKYLSQTIDDFRDFIKDNREEQTLFTITATLEKAFHLINAGLEENHIKLIKQFEGDAQVKGYQNEIIQVIINLLNNAKDALVLNVKDEKNRFIIARIKLQKDRVIIEIQDNAGGVPIEILPRVFEPYFTTKHQSVGTGIGLYMARDIISNHHNGIIEVKNDSLQHNDKKYNGALFSISLKVV